MCVEIRKVNSNPYYELEFFLEPPVTVELEELRCEIQCKLDEWKKLSRKERTTHIDTLIVCAEKYIDAGFEEQNLDQLYTQARTTRLAELQQIFANEDAKDLLDYDEQENTLQRIEKNYPYFHSNTIRKQFDLYNKKIIHEHRRKKRIKQKEIDKDEMLKELLILFNESEVYNPNLQSSLEQCRKQIAGLKNVDLLNDGDIDKIVTIIESQLQEKISWRPDSWTRFELAFPQHHRLIQTLKKWKGHYDKSL
jgi:hypothetical protein